MHWKEAMENLISFKSVQNLSPTGVYSLDASYHREKVHLS